MKAWMKSKKIKALKKAVNAEMGADLFDADCFYQDCQNRKNEKHLSFFHSLNQNKAVRGHYIRAITKIGGNNQGA